MKWQIKIDNFLGGYAPAWYKETYPSYGNKNQAGAMQNVDLLNPGYITQGPGLSNLTNGTEAGSVTTLIRDIMPLKASGSLYAVGGNVFYEISSTSVISIHTIDKAGSTAESGYGVIEYKNDIYYAYNHTTGGSGDIGLYDFSTFDDDYMSTVPSGATDLSGTNLSPLTTPRHMIVGGNDILYISNGRYVASFDGTTFIPQALDFPDGSTIRSLAWLSDRLWILVDVDDSTASGPIKSSIYIWDGTATSWEAEIRVGGNGGALFVKDEILYVFYRDTGTASNYKFGYVSGANVEPIATFQGGLPLYYQVTTHEDHILWVAGDKIYAWGSGFPGLPAKIFQYADGGYSTVGGIKSSIGTVFVASNQSSSYKLAKFSGYDTNCNWKSLMFDIAGTTKVPATIDGVRINFEKLEAEARVDWKLLDNQGRTIYNDTISYAKATATIPMHTLTSAFYPISRKVAENFRIEFDWTNGSLTNPVKIKNATIYGTN